MAITLGDNEREAAWRKEVRTFINNEAPVALKSGGEEGENSLFGRMGAIKEWREKVADKGWIAPSWPSKYGGADMSVAVPERSCVVRARLTEMEPFMPAIASKSAAAMVNVSLRVIWVSSSFPVACY